MCVFFLLYFKLNAFVYFENNSGDTTEAELCRVFSSYGNVKSTKIIVDRAGVSKGYGFVTFETEQEAQRLQADVCVPIVHSIVYCFRLFFLQPNRSHIDYWNNSLVTRWILCSWYLLLLLFLSQGECVVLRDRKLNIAPAIKKQVNFVRLFLRLTLILIFDKSQI